MTFYVPSLWLRIAGAGGELTNPPQLKCVSIHQRLGLPALCEVEFAGLPDALAPLAVGQSLEVSIQDEEVLLFTGDVTAVEYLYPPAAAPSVRLRGYDCLARLRKRQRVRAYPDCSLKGLLRDLAGNGAELVGSDLDWPLLVQHQQNDFEFLSEQAALVGCYPLARGGKIYLLPLSGLPGQSDIALEYGRSLSEAVIEANAEESCASVSVYGWETARSGITGAQEQAAQIGRQVDIHVDVCDVGGSPDRLLVNQGLESDPHAVALARAELERRRAAEVVFWGRAEGSPSLQPGVPVWVSNVAPAVSGRYILTGVIHTFDYTSGYTVELTSEPPPPVQRSRCDVATLGVVIDVRDPHHLGRIRARLSAYDDVETGWMQVVCPGAGRGKGFVSLPDPGDRVLVLLACEDPARGIVLGGLFAPDRPPDDGIEAGRAERYSWTTKAGQQIRLDRDGHFILIENGAGARIEMKGNEIVFKAGRIDFRRS